MDLTGAVETLTTHPFIAILLAVGAYGWFRLASRDTIIGGLRNWFYRHWPHEGFVSHAPEPPKRGKHVFSAGTWYCTDGTFFGELLVCPFCLGWWIAIAQFLAFAAWPVPVLALAFVHTSRILGAFLAHHVG